MAAWGGMVADLNEAGVDADFLDEVSVALTPGESAVVAEVDEAWVAPVDTRLGEQGGLVFRRLRSEVVDEQLVREAEAFNWELTELEEEAAQASAEAKEKISERIAATKQKLQAIQNQASAKIEQAKKEQEAKVQTLQNQLQEAAAEKKAKIENRISEVKTDYAARSGKLKEAWNMTKQALA